MKILICGDRYWYDTVQIWKFLRWFPRDTIIIHGAAKGADMTADYWARKMGFTVERFPARWDHFRPADPTRKNPAGAIRNSQMADEHPDLVVAFNDHIERSAGTANMLCIAEDRGIPYCLFTMNDDIPELQ